MSRITIKDVAKAAGVSIATVSNVINQSGRVSEETIERVKKIIDELQYIPSASARSLRDKHTHLIAVIVPYADRTTLQDNPFYWQLVSAIESGARNHRLHVLLVGVSEEETFSFVREKHLDGLIVVGTFSDSPIMSSLADIQVPCVYLDSYLEDEDLYQIYVDDRKGGYLGAKHLLEQGHRRLALLSNSMTEGGVGEVRYAGFMEAVKEYGVSDETVTLICEDVSMEGGYRAASRIAEFAEGITGVMAFSDIAATGLIKGLHDRGIRVPNDVSVIGFDDLMYSRHMIPSLTTIAQNLSEKGRLSVQLLMEQIECKPPRKSRKVVLPVKLEVRESTANHRSGN
ncbi:LacI family DNA-binding transcriptional regulator [Paenibacillus gansuensis]|uniref:LacI family DNA-binding transcriptional regulator n=1 Tax=Paenibacillus gansuensis TaxID=306542 RepID=A0ABW5P9A7_9BACL